MLGHCYCIAVAADEPQLALLYKRLCDTSSTNMALLMMVSSTIPKCQAAAAMQSSGDRMTAAEAACSTAV